LHAEIQKFYGESTADGLNWQFRGIKKIAEAQKNAVQKGESPVDVINSIGTPSTSKKAVSTPGSRASKAASTTKTPTTGPRSARTGLKRKEHTFSDDDGSDTDWSRKDREMDTPSNRKKAKTNAKATPRNDGVASANATPTAGPNAVRATITPTAKPKSSAALFGNATRTPGSTEPFEVIDLVEDVPNPVNTAGLGEFDSSFPMDEELALSLERSQRDAHAPAYEYPIMANQPSSNDAFHYPDLADGEA
jgi:hypothetical protein